MVCNTLSKAFIYLKVTLAGCSGFGWLVAVGRTFSEGFCLQSRNKKLVIRSPQDRVVSGRSLPEKLDFSEIYLAICLFLVFYSSVYTFFLSLALAWPVKITKKLHCYYYYYYYSRFAVLAHLKMSLI